MSRSSRVTVASTRVLFVLLAVSLLLVALHASLQVATRSISPSFPGWETIIVILDIDSETSIPTWWASLLLTIAAVVTAIAGLVARDRNTRDQIYLWSIAAILFLMSIDEQAMIHEHAIVPLRERFGFSGPLFFAWVVPGSIAVLIFIVVFGRFVYRQPPAIRRLLIMSGGLYLSGALIMEMVGGWWSESNGPHNYTYLAIVSVEESLEYAGVSTYIFAMLNLLAAQRARVELMFASGRSTG